MIQHLPMWNTYGNADKCFSLSCPSRAGSPRLFCSRFSLFFFFFLPLGTEWEGRTRGWYSFLNHHRLNCMKYFPLEGTLMIPRQNDICLRPTGMARPDGISTGIMSGGISSAPVRWAGEVLESETRWNYMQAWLCVWSNAKWSLEQM